MIETLIGLGLVGAVVAVWLASLRARELAVRECRHYCRRHNLQFLDDTVALDRFALARSARGTLTLRRFYRFEFSQIGYERQRGHIILLGPEIESMILPSLDDA